MDPELSPQVIEFADNNKVNGYFVDNVIKTAAELKHTYSFDDGLFPTMVLSSIGKKQKALITGDVDQLMSNNPQIQEEYDLPATKADFERVPQYIGSRFPKETEEWKNKDIAIQIRWILYFDKISSSIPFASADEPNNKNIPPSNFTILNLANARLYKRLAPTANITGGDQGCTNK
ncbi:MAG: hypothetical protein ACTHK0_00175 [Ginsengibacter sp.]